MIRPDRALQPDDPDIQPVDATPLACPHCGYDLRGTQPDRADRFLCPECGEGCSHREAIEASRTARERLHELRWRLLWPSWIVLGIGAVAVLDLFWGDESVAFLYVFLVLPGVAVGGPTILAIVIWQETPSWRTFGERLAEAAPLVMTHILRNLLLIGVGLMTMWFILDL